MIMMPTLLSSLLSCSLFFFFNDTATTEIYTLSLHDALPILNCLILAYPCPNCSCRAVHGTNCGLSLGMRCSRWASQQDRKSTRLNSSHANISYAVFCLKKKTPKY